MFVAASAVRENGWSAAGDAPHLVFDWRPDGSVDALAAEVARVAARVTGAVEAAVCPHPGGPPTCWCRPPLPGLPLAFARAHGVDLVAVDARRHEPGASHAGDDPRRALRSGLAGRC